MKAASIQELKQELNNLSQKELAELCIRLAKFKKENKEFLNYLLFESYDQHGYLQTVKKEMDEEFRTLPKTSPYLNKKALRKILKLISKYNKHMASRQAEAEMLIYFCQKVKDSGIRIYRSTMLTNLYNQQIKKIRSALESLHEDLKFDYTKQLEALV
jgi:hypothetical protein